MNVNQRIERAIFRFLKVHLGYSVGNGMKHEEIGGRDISDIICGISHSGRQSIKYVK